MIFVVSMFIYQTRHLISIYGKDTAHLARVTTERDTTRDAFMTNKVSNSDCATKLVATDPVYSSLEFL